MDMGKSLKIKLNVALALCFGRGPFLVLEADHRFGYPRMMIYMDKPLHYFLRGIIPKSVGKRPVLWYHNLKDLS